MSPLAQAEYEGLRATIRSRGQARPLAFLTGISSWALVLVITVIWLPNPITAAIPLVILLSTFEVVRVLHLNVERIGRYLQVFFEETTTNESLEPPAWERCAMLFGPKVPGAGGHPFFLPTLVLATLVNFVSVLLPGPLAIEWITMAVPHAALIVWMLDCDRRMRRQRGTELARFRELKDRIGPTRA
jgi:hypothetical protein